MLGKLESHMQKKKLDYYLIPPIKMNSKRIKDLNVRPESIKLQVENIDSALFDIGLSNIFLYMSPQTRKQKHKQTIGTTSN